MQLFGAIFRLLDIDDDGELEPAELGHWERELGGEKGLGAAVRGSIAGDGL